MGNIIDNLVLGIIIFFSVFGFIYFSYIFYLVYQFCKEEKEEERIINEKLKDVCRLLNRKEANNG